MGILSCPLSSHTAEREESHSQSNQSDSSTSLSSQSSLPSLPSLHPTSSQRKHPTAATHRCVSTLKGHSSPVFSLCLNGNSLFSGSSDKEIRLWDPDPQTSTVVATGKGAVKSLLVLNDKLFSAHQDHKIRVWRIDGEKTCHHHPRRRTQYKCLATLPTLNDRLTSLLSAGNYVEVRRHKKATWVHHVDTVSALAISKDGSQLYSASWDRSFKVWRTSDFKCLESVCRAHDDAINAIVLSSDGTYVYTGSADRKIKVWRKKKGEKRHANVETLDKHKSAVNALAISGDGSVLFSGACDRSVVVWERDGGAMVVVGALRGHTKAILCLAVVGDLLISGSADRTVRVWRREEGRMYSCLSVCEGHKGPVKCLTAVIDGDINPGSCGDGSSCLVYSGSLDYDIKVWKILLPFV